MLGKRLLKLMEWFMHPSVLENQNTVEGAERLWKSQLAVGVSFIVSLFLVVMFILRFSLEGLQQKSLLLLPIAGLLFSTFPFIFLKKLNNYAIPNYLLMGFACLILPARVLSDGGVSSSTLAWFTLWPIVSTLLMNIRFGAAMTTIAVIEIIVLTQAKTLGLPVMESSPLPMVRGSITVILVLILYFVIHRFEIERRRQLGRLRENEKRLGSAVKSESLVKMAEGLAHEINNPMTIALGNLAKIKKSEYSQKEKEKIEKIERSLDRVNSLVKRLQFFSKRDLILTLEEFDLKPITEELLQKMEYYDSSKTIQFVNQIHQPLVIFGDKIKITMALEGIIINSIEALLNSSQGFKEIRLDLNQTDTEYIISVIDNGPGIEASLKDRILDPFFTTKSDKNATGLGLSLALGIIEKHRGKLEFHSDDRITTFQIILPKPLANADQAKVLA